MSPYSYKIVLIKKCISPRRKCKSSRNCSGTQSCKFSWAFPASSGP